MYLNMSFNNSKTKPKSNKIEKGLKLQNED